MGCSVFGEVVEGDETLAKINNTITDKEGRPYQDIRITHTVVLHDPYDDPAGLEVREGSPEPTAEMLASSRIGADENINDYAGKSADEINEIIASKEALARATILEMVGDLPDADVAPPENVLFVCKLNPVTCDDDLEIIFSRFGPVVCCEVIRDKISGESLQYAFVEFEEQSACEQAYFKMDNVLIDDRRIHVDFSQSVSKYRWKGKGRLETFDDKKHEQEKKQDMKDLIDKERAEINVKDGRIERKGLLELGGVPKDRNKEKNLEKVSRYHRREERQADRRRSRSKEKRFRERRRSRSREERRRSLSRERRDSRERQRERRGRSREERREQPPRRRDDSSDSSKERRPYKSSKKSKRRRSSS